MKRIMLPALLGNLCFAVPAFAADAPAKAPKAGGQLPKEAIHRVVQTHRDDTLACYTDALARNPKLGGKIVIQFIIDAKGAVSESKVLSSDVGDTRLGECVAEKARGWAFPKPKGGGVVKVSYPFAFEPNTDSTENIPSKPAPAKPSTPGGK